MLQHRLATPVIQPRMYFFDKDGKPLIGGKVYTFKVGTDEFKPTYRNSEFTAANQNPILLDQAGSALIYVRGSNQLKIYDRNDNFIEQKIEYQQRETAQFFDNYGKPLSNGKIWTYDYQSTIRKKSYKLDDILNPNPVILNENGIAAINIVGAYRLRVLNKSNVVIGDQDFKRPPVKVLTSRPYPLFHEESVATGFDASDDVDYDEIRWHESSFSDDVSVGLSVHNVMMRDSSPIPHIENVALSLTVHDVILSEIPKTNLVENMSLSLAVHNVKYAIPINNNHIERVSLSLTLLDAEVEYI